jgi:cell wall-associated NlpC family hydrolase
VQRGDSIDSLARRFHVSVRDIARANSISVDAVLSDGRRLIVPDPPKAALKPAREHLPARVSHDRVAVRLGPDQGYRRVTLLDSGASLVVTRRAGEWSQVILPDGRAGWILSEFVTPLSNRSAPRLARVEQPRRAKRPATSTAKSRRLAAHRRRPLRPVAAHPASAKRTATPAAPKHRREARAAALVGRSPRAVKPQTDRDDVVRTALAFRGVHYRYGGSSRSGFDCSGFTRYVYGRKGVSLPHSAADQFGHGRRVSGSEIRPGDLVFFHTTSRGISHVGLYIGSGKFVHASSGGGRVRVDSLNDGYYRRRFRGARRVK